MQKGLLPRNETIFACMLIEIGARALGIVKKGTIEGPDITVLAIGLGACAPEKIPDIDLRSRNNFASEV
jgi:hypothetical protein